MQYYHTEYKILKRYTFIKTFFICVSWNKIKYFHYYVCSISILCLKSEILNLNALKTHRKMFLSFQINLGRRWVEELKLKLEDFRIELT